MVGEAQLHGCIVVDTVMGFNDSTKKTTTKTTKQQNNKKAKKNKKTKKERTLSWNQASKAPCADQPANVQTLTPLLVSG